MEYLEDTLDNGQTEDLYKFKLIQDHRGPYSPSDPEYLQSSCNLPTEWETGDMTWETLTNIIADDPYSCAVYSKKFDLLNTQECQNSKKSHQNPQDVQVQTSQSIKEVQTWMESSKRLCSCPTT